MRILLTGASGFIGTGLLKLLGSDREHEVFAVSRSRMPSSDNVHWISRDLTQPGWTDGFPDRVDVVVHLAQSRHYRAFPERVQDVVAVNVDSTVALADWAYRHEVKRFLFASTGTVYPTNMRRPIREDDPPNPASLYGASKLCSELLLEQYGKLYEVVLMRLFGVYGPGQRAMLIPETIQRILAGEPIILARGEGPHLSPLFLADCVAMIDALLRVPLPETVERINLAGPEEVSLAQVVVILETLLARRAQIQVSEDIALYLVGSAETANRLIGRMSFVSLAEGLRQTVEGLERAPN